MEEESLPKIVNLFLQHHKHHDRDLIGLNMAIAIRDGRVTSDRSSRVKFCEENSIKESYFYSVLVLLKKIGLVKRIGNSYVINPDFGTDIQREFIQFLMSRAT